MTVSSNRKPERTERGARIAWMLRGAWRVNPPPLDFAADDAPEMLARAAEAQVAGLLWWRLRDSPFAATLFGAQLRAEYVAQSVSAAHATYRVQHYVRALRARDIESIVFKGWALFSHYAETGLRPAGDVDLAVAPHDAPRAVEILRGLGATPTEVDVHPGLADAAHAALIPHARWAEVLERSQIKSAGDVAVRVLAPEDELTIVALHCARHLYARPLWLCDVAACVETCPPDFDWPRALSVPPFKSWIEIALLLAERLLDADLHATPLAGRARRLPRWLEREVLTRWNERYAISKTPHPSLLRVWRDPSQWRAAIRARTPNRLAAALEFQAGLDEPLLARYQARVFLRRIVTFARRNLPRPHF